MDNIYLNKEAKSKLITGINKVCDAVKVTLGSAGSNVILEEEMLPYHSITNDGISIAEKIKLGDPVENIGANIMKEVANRSNRESGDGTTTSMVLTQAILEAGMESDESPMDIKRSLDECLPIIHKSIDEQTLDISPEHIASVANISAEDEEIANQLQDIYTEIGKDGIVELESSTIPETHYEIIDGVRLRNCGFTYPYMTNDGKGKSATFLVPKVLITKEKITSVMQIDPIYKALSQNGVNELVIFCEDIDPIVSEYIAKAHMQGLFKTLVIKAPTLWKDWLFEDFAKITGATIINPVTGTTLKKIQMFHLGSCDKIVTTKDETIVIGIHDITAHIKALEEVGDDDSKLRLAWLKTKAAVLKIGGNSESELRYRYLKTEDARNASYLALKGGVVAGGGIALLNSIADLPDTIGGKILKVALKAPVNQIMFNAGYVANKTDKLGGEKGFNSKTGKIVNMWDAQIVDPAIVVKNSIKNAISIAGTVLTANGVITKHETIK